MNVRNTLAQLRAKRGIGAAQLASQVGVSRQTVYAIEAGTYVPNTVVSLKIARVLDTSVEDLFQLEAEEAPAVKEAEAVVLGGSDSLSAGQPLRLCRVNHHTVAVAPEPGSWGLTATDGLLLELRRDEGPRHLCSARVRFVGESWKNPSRLLIAGCDPSAPILVNALPRQDCELIVAFENSSRSLELLKEGLVHVAGTHMVNNENGEMDLSPIVRLFPRNSVAVFSYATWREGFVVTRGNPKEISGISDLMRKDVRIANRELGSGCRRLLDDLLAEAGIPPARVKGYDHIVEGQLPVARLVQRGIVDCCVCAEVGARSLGLDFIPLAEKPYHLVVQRKHLDMPPIQTLIETLGKLSFRREVETCVGYDMREAGERIR
jgi:putative molybdopterin biosynthesis protein